MRQYVQSHAQDELLKIYRREYMRRFARIRVGKVSQKVCSAWSKEAQKEKEKCESGQDLTAEICAVTEAVIPT